MKKARPPIVTVLGHVDHGKTTLLDALRGSNVTAREAGGITQSTSFSTIKTSEGDITFIDTPGHALFSKMRERGSKLADIALLVVAADDGVKPQTQEALDYIKNVKIPYIVVFNKIDLPSSDIPRAQGELMERGVLFEGMGGDVAHVAVSAKNKQGLSELIEIINLMAQVNEISGNGEDDLDGIVIEANKDKRGNVVTVIVKNGKINVGDEIYCDNLAAHVKGIFNNEGKAITEILPGYGGEILGFLELPAVGSLVCCNSEDAKKIKQEIKENKEIDKGQIGIVLKASTSGKLEAIRGALPENVVIISSGVGDANDSDIFLAKSSGSEVVCFECKISSGIKRLADTEGVILTNFKIIYELIEYLTDLVKNKQTKISGKAIVIDMFPFNNKKVAGVKISEGLIKNGDRLIIMRGQRELGNTTIRSLKRGKEDITEAKAGEECGILFTPQLDFDKGDVLLSASK
jgi:translation initiation factor IF-2